MTSDITPFEGRTSRSSAPTRVLRRFVKAKHVAEIHERTVTAFSAVEFVVFVDGALKESQLFHGKRLNDYPQAVEATAKRFTDNRWIEQSA